MLEWYEAIKKLTEVSGAERTAFVVQATSPHKRTASDSSRRADSFSSENGIDNDDADEIPYSGQHSTTEDDPAIYGDDPLEPPRRPDVGRFPSDIQVNRDLELRHSDDSSGSAVAAISALPGAPYPDNNGYHGREDDACVDAHYDAYTGNCGTHDSRALERGYVVVPPLNRRQRDSPFPWSEEKVEPPSTSLLVRHRSTLLASRKRDSEKRSCIYEGYICARARSKTETELAQTRNPRFPGSWRRHRSA